MLISSQVGYKSKSYSSNNTKKFIVVVAKMGAKFEVFKILRWKKKVGNLYDEWPNK